MSGGRAPPILITADAVGGVWQYSVDLAGELALLGYDPMIAVLGPPPSPAQLESAGDVSIVPTGLPLDWLVDGPDPVREGATAIARLARDAGADLVQLNMPTLAAFGGFGQPTVAVAHGCVATWWQATRQTRLGTGFAWHARLTRRGLKAVDRVVAPSAAHAEAVRARYRLGQSPDVVHNGRRPARTALAPAPAKGAFTAGRLWDEAKNMRLLDRVAGRLSAPFRAAGDTIAPHGERFEAAHLQLRGQLGESAMRAELAARPVFVSAALFEPFGLAVLEAAAAGCPLVLSDIPTFRELWDGAARFVPAEDEAGFAHAIGKLIGNPAGSARLGRAARERAASYTSRAMAAGMARIFAELGVPGAPSARMAA
ncbi:glycosyltransferase [Sphingomonas gilva]|uniref:Glycosyltransferase n=1 Tax=Sphingomonas gilva TaxID=2305907 RepID=A0A396RMA3_9SPHN|nr:glycosyltransferase family 4 protein [Sphingomonas gilva]RHW17547.1 glycosyltransferase [Sphingomonas gilva]